MPLYTNTEIDQYGRPIPGAKVYVYTYDDGGLASLTDSIGNSIGNPVETDGYGVFEFYASTGLYNIDSWLNGVLYYKDRTVPVGDILLPPDILVPVQNLIDASLAASQAAQDAALAGATGSSIIGWQQSGSGAVARTVETKLRDPNQTVRDFGAATDGVTNARPAFALADVVGAFTVPRGLYLISSSITIANPVTFDPGARLVIPNGVTVTFQSAITAPLTQIFNLTGTGAVAGLFEAWFEWFGGDKKASGGTAPSVDCRAALNAFAAALNVVGVDYITLGGSIARIGPGSWLVDGSTITIFHNCSIHGAGSGQTNFLWSGSQTNGFSIIGNRGSFSGFQWAPATAGTIPTAGSAMYVEERNGLFDDIIVNDCFIGWNVLGTAGSNSYRNCPVYGALAVGRRVNGSEHHWHDSHVVAIPDWSSLTSIVGTFSVGDVVSISNSSGVITDSFGGGKFKIAWVGNRPAPPTALTNTTSSGSATLSSNTPAHSIAGLYWYTATGATDTGNITDDSDVIGGDWGLVGQGMNANSVVSNPAWCRTDVTLCIDTTYYGSKLDKVYGWDLHGWFSSSRDKDAKGLTLTNSNRVRLNSLQCVNNSGQGLYIDNTNQFIQVISPEMDGNCHNVSAAPAMAEIAFVSGSGQPVHDITLTGGTSGYPDLFGRTPPLGLYVGYADGTSGALASRVILAEHNVASGRATINATQINGTDQRLRIIAVTGLTDQ